MKTRSLVFTLLLISILAGPVFGQGFPVWPIVVGALQNKTAPADAKPAHIVDWINHNTSTLSGVLANRAAPTAPGYDNCGYLRFYALHNGQAADGNLFIYSPSGALLYPAAATPGTGLNASSADGEIQVVPVPETSNAWYLIYNVNDASSVYTPSSVAYSILRFNGSTWDVAVSERNIVLTEGTNTHTYNKGKAVSRRIAAPTPYHALYLCRRATGIGTIYLDMYKITSTGIAYSTSSDAIADDWWSLTTVGSPIELDNAGLRVAVLSRKEDSQATRCHLFNAANLTSHVSISLHKLMLVPNITEFPLYTTAKSIEDLGSGLVPGVTDLGWLANFDRKMTGMQFSPNGQYLYICGGGFVEADYGNLSYIGQIDLGTTTALPASGDGLDVRLQTQFVANWQSADGRAAVTSGSDITQGAYWGRVHTIATMQLAHNQNIYFTKFNCDTLFVLPDPNNPMPQRLAPGNVNLATGTAQNIVFDGYVGVMPDQIDGMNYMENTTVVIGGATPTMQVGQSITLTCLVNGTPETNGVSWIGGGGYLSASGVFHPLSPGTYTITVSVLIGGVRCMANTVVEVVKPSDPCEKIDIIITPNESTCSATIKINNNYLPGVIQYITIEIHPAGAVQIGSVNLLPGSPATPFTFTASTAGANFPGGLPAGMQSIATLSLTNATSSNPFFIVVTIGDGPAAPTFICTDSAKMSCKPQDIRNCCDTSTFKRSVVIESSTLVAGTSYTPPHYWLKGRISSNRPLTRFSIINERTYAVLQDEHAVLNATRDLTGYFYSAKGGTNPWVFPTLGPPAYSPIPSATGNQALQYISAYHGYGFYENNHVSGGPREIKWNNEAINGGIDCAASPGGLTNSSSTFEVRIAWQPDELNAMPVMNASIHDLYYSLRFEFTDTSCRSCWTRSVGRMLYWWKDYVHGLREPVRPGTIKMNSFTAGTFFVDLPRLLDSANTLQIDAIDVQSDPACPVLSMKNNKDGSTASIANGVASISLKVAEQEKASLAITYDNPGKKTAWKNLVTYRGHYEPSQLPMVWSDSAWSSVPLTSASAQDSMGADATGKRTVHTYSLYFLNNNAGKEKIRCIIMKPKGKAAIIAVGPPSDSMQVMITPRKAPDGSLRYSFDEPCPGCVPEVTGERAMLRRIYLTVSGGSGGVVSLDFLSINDRGDSVSTGTVTLNDPMTTGFRGDEGGGDFAQPSGLSLAPNYPNPATQSATLQFSLRSAMRDVTLRIVDLGGKEVLRVVDNGAFEQGDHAVVINTAQLPSGTYFTILSSGTQQARQKMLITK